MASSPVLLASCNWLPMRWQALRGQGINAEREGAGPEAEPKDEMALFLEDCCDAIAYAEQRVRPPPAVGFRA